MHEALACARVSESVGLNLVITFEMAIRKLTHSLARRASICQTGRDGGAITYRWFANPVCTLDSIQLEQVLKFGLASF